MEKQKVISKICLISLILISPIIVDAQTERGAGSPVVDVITPITFRQDYRSDVETLVVNVKNIGNSDGFSIVPESKTGKLIFTPSSYVSQPIAAGEEKKFNFTISLGGAILYGSSAKEDIELRVTPEHNSDARVVKTFSMDIYYMSERQPKASGFQFIYALGIILITLFFRKRGV